MDTKKYQDKLEREARDLKEHIAKIEKGENFGDDVDGFEEDADQAEQIGSDLSMQEAYEERLARIEDALRKIKLGEYGICESCGAHIETEILDIDPESEFCKSCKKNHKEII